MKNLRMLCAALTLTAMLAIPAFAGDIGTPLTDPPPAAAGNIGTGATDGEIGTGLTSQGASATAWPSAAEVALSLLQGALSLV